MCAGPCLRAFLLTIRTILPAIVGPLFGRCTAGGIPGHPRGDSVRSLFGSLAPRDVADVCIRPLLSLSVHSASFFRRVERHTLSFVVRVPMRIPVVPLGVHTCVGFPRLQHSARARSCHLGLRACSVASPPAASLLSTRRAPARCTSLFAPCRLSPPPRFPPLLWPPGAAPRARRRSHPHIRLAARARAPAA